jgi:GT2 family glycosyltransferase
MISAVFVSYHSAERAARAIASFRRDAEGSGLRCETIAVVNSGDPAERGALEASADLVLAPDSNLGYAGGLNAGLARARGEVLFLANPDLVFEEGSVRALAEAVAGPGLLAAGPAFWGDGARTILMPPSEEARPEELARRALAADPRRAPRVFRREVRRALAQAEAAAAGRTRPVRGLSGALMAASRRTLEAVGGFDEGYRLYYEENDWQRRLLLAGGRLLWVGGANVVHYFGQSSRKEPRAAAWFAESESRYFATHFGAAGVRGLERLAALSPAEPGGTARVSLLSWSAPDPAAVAVSPYPNFRPFGLALVPPGGRTWRLPEDFARARSGEPLWVRVFARESGATLAEGRFEPA